MPRPLELLLSYIRAGLAAFNDLPKTLISLRLVSPTSAIGDIGCDPSRLVFRQQLGGRAPARLILEIDISELLSVVVADDEVGGLLLDGPRRREAAGGHTVIMRRASAPAHGRGSLLADLLANHSK